MKVQSADFVRSAPERAQMLRDGLPAVAFVGRSNVGKSSVMNRLLGRKGLARTSSTPGRTQAVNYFLVNRRWYFTDLPGYGYAKAAKAARQRWGEVVDQYLRHTRPSPLVVLLIDGKVGATALDRQAYGYFVSLDLALTVAATKIDKVPKNRRHRALAVIHRELGLPPEGEIVALSAMSGEGIPELWKAIGVFLDAHQQTLQKAKT